MQAQNGGGSVYTIIRGEVAEFCQTSLGGLQLPGQGLLHRPKPMPLDAVVDELFKQIGRGRLGQAAHAGGLGEIADQRAVGSDTVAEYQHGGLRSDGVKFANDRGQATGIQGGIEQHHRRGRGFLQSGNGGILADDGYKRQPIADLILQKSDPLWFSSDAE